LPIIQEKPDPTTAGWEGESIARQAIGQGSDRAQIAASGSVTLGPVSPFNVL
jgi:hypothetical protein